MDSLPPEALLAEVPGPMRDIGERLRTIVHRTTPEAIERVRPGWRLIGYDLPLGRRRTVYFAMIWAEPVHVHLGFEHGALMHDPRGLLEGRGITKKVRWLTFTPGSMLDEDVISELILEAARVATMSRSERALLAMARTEAEEAPTGRLKGHVASR